MRKSKSTKKKGKMQLKRIHRNNTQSRPEMDIREGRQVWIERRKKKK